MQSYNNITTSAAAPISQVCVVFTASEFTSLTLKVVVTAASADNDS